MELNVTELDFLKTAPDLEELRARARELRTVARTMEDPAVFMPYVQLAETYEALVEAVDLDNVIELQRSWVENS